MRRFLLTVVLLASLTAIPPAQADGEFEALLGEYTEARTAWRAQDKSDAATPAEDPIHTFLPRFKLFAQKNVGKSAAIPALAWIIDNAPRYLRGEEGKATARWAAEILTSDHAADPALRNHLSRLRYAYYRVGKEPLVGLYERILELNQDQNARAWATFNLGFISYREDDGMKAALPLFRKVVDEYPDSAVASTAKRFVFEGENLQIGMTAPEIVGTDANDQEIRLSQFRGQVVVLDFWGFW